MMRFSRRFDASFRAVRERNRGGELGRLEQLIIISPNPAPPPPAYAAGDDACAAMTSEPWFADGRTTLALADAAARARSGRSCAGCLIPLTAGLSRPMEERTPPAWVSDTARRQSVRPPAGST